MPNLSYRFSMFLPLFSFFVFSFPSTCMYLFLVRSFLFSFISHFKRRKKKMVPLAIDVRNNTMLPNAFTTIVTYNIVSWSSRKRSVTLKLFNCKNLTSFLTHMHMLTLSLSFFLALSLLFLSRFFSFSFPIFLSLSLSAMHTHYRVFLIKSIIILSLPLDLFFSFSLVHTSYLPKILSYSPSLSLFLSPCLSFYLSISLSLAQYVRYIN